FSLEITAGSERVTPVRAFHVTPPLIMVGQRNRMIRRREDDRTRHEILGRGSRKLFSARGALRDGDITGGADELRELFIGDFGFIHPEAIDLNAMDRLGVAAHCERAA